MKKVLLIITIILTLTITGFCKWYIPEVYYDPDNAWENETLIYDGLDNTAGSTIISDAKTWSSFILLDVYSEIYCEVIKFLAYQKGATGIEQIDIDLYYDSAWHDLYEGVFNNQEWTEIKVTPWRYLYSARIRFYAKKADTAMLYGFEFWNPDITIGNAATDRAASIQLYYTRIDYINAASGTGNLDTIEIYMALAATNDVYIATFEEVSSNHFTARDVVNVGTLAIGYHELTTDKSSDPISLSVETGDYIGIFSLSGSVELDVSGGGFYYFLAKDSNQTSCTNTEFIFTDNRQMSLYASGGAGEEVTVGHIFFTLSDF